MNDTSTQDAGMAGMPSEDEQDAGGAAGTPSEDELRAAYEAELNRIASADLILQTAASLLNLGARRLGLTGAPEAERDLEQVRDAIDGVRALMPILERRHAGELAQLRDALAQLQMAYAQESQRKAVQQTEPEQAAEQSSGAEPPGAEKTASPPPPAGARQKPQPGPAEASGRLWVPGR